MATTAQVTKKQHFVPQFYLRGFTNATNEVEVLDCRQRKILSPRGTKGICYEKFYYGLRTGEHDEVSNYIENGLQKIEDAVSKNLESVLPKLLNNEHISDREKWDLAYLMSMLWIRGPMMRGQINRMTEQAYKSMASLHFSTGYADRMFDRLDRETGQRTPPEMREKVRKSIVEKQYSTDFGNQQHLAMFETMPNFANMFYGQDWVIHISKSSKKFVTADSPVAMVIPKHKGFYPPGFLERTHYLALSPDICIKARYPKEESGKKIRRKTLFESDNQKILSLNLTIANHAHDYVYAREKQSLEDIINFVALYEQSLPKDQQQSHASTT